MSIVETALARRTCKAFDPEYKISDAKLQELLTLLRYAPSSVNAQPWQFLVAASEAAKARLTVATPAGFAYNEAKIRQASHVIVMCARTQLSVAYQDHLIRQEAQDGRFPTTQAQETQAATRAYYLKLHQEDACDLPAWASRQVYLALGVLLLGAAELGIDACPMEGFDGAALDRELGLTEQGLTPVVLVALGARAATDFNAALPKSRLAASEVIRFL